MLELIQIEMRLVMTKMTLVKARAKVMKAKVNQKRMRKLFLEELALLSKEYRIL